MTKKRSMHSPELKARVAQEAIKGIETASEIGARFGVHPQQVSDWKREAISRMSELFQSKRKNEIVEPSEDVASLQKKIGQLTMENDFLARGLGLVVEPKKGK